MSVTVAIEEVGVIIKIKNCSQRCQMQHFQSGSSQDSSLSFFETNCNFSRSLGIEIKAL